MNILITQSVTAATEVFAGLGQLQVIPDQALAHADLTDIDAVIMRSQSQVSVEQVTGTRVKFIGSATAGLDHLPVDALQALGIQVANAPGCNANSVADYWLSAALSQGLPLPGKTLGVVGYGAVGQLVAKRATALGLNVIVNDPPRVASQPGDITHPIVSLPDLFAQADIISLHVPLTTTGPWPTCNLVDAALLANLKPGVMFINTARGEVCDAAALVEAKAKGFIADLIIDVWPNEPDVDTALWQAATIATPHIAGHSYVAKWQGTWQVYQALLASLNKFLSVQDSSVRRVRGRDDSKLIRDLKQNSPGLLRYARNDIDELASLWHYVQQVYDVRQDHRHMQAWLALPASERAVAFSRYRRDYPMRGELSLAHVAEASLTPWQREVLLSAGVTLC